MAGLVVVGGGINGLAAAALLARAGHGVLVLERRSVLGGWAATEELAPGFSVSSGLHACPLLCPRLVDELDLARHGLALLPEPVGVFAPGRDGSSLLLPGDPAQARAALAELGSDADRWLEYRAFLSRLAPLVGELAASVPPPLGYPGLAGLWQGWKLARAFRAADARTQAELLRVGPMCVADFLGERFESDLLRGALAAPALWWSWAGPRSAGTTANLLAESIGQPRCLVRGGMGGLVAALAASARAAGAEIRTGCEVARIRVEAGRAVGVRTAGGEEFAADGVVSAADPRRTFLSLVGPEELTPGFAWRVRAMRCRGTLAKVHLAVSELPDFLARPGKTPGLHHRGRIHLGGGTDDLERAFDAAKYRRLPEAPALDLLIPTVTDPSLAPPGAHVLSIYVHHVAAELADLSPEAARTELAARVEAGLARVAPNVPRSILHREVLLPRDLEARFGTTGGHPAHLEHALDQLFLMRPAGGWAGYRTPIRRLWLAGMGTHPGGGISGRPGANAARVILREL